MFQINFSLRAFSFRVILKRLNKKLVIYGCIHRKIYIRTGHPVTVNINISDLLCNCENNNHDSNINALWPVPYIVLHYSVLTLYGVELEKIEQVFKTINIHANKILSSSFFQVVCSQTIFVIQRKSALTVRTFKNEAIFNIQSAFSTIVPNI